MMRFIMPIILVAIAGSLFFVLANPLYGDIKLLREEAASYNEALDNSKALENERDKLTAKYNAIDPANLMNLTKLLPENVDNIRLILEIEQIAMPYGMLLKDIQYNADDEKTEEEGGRVVGGASTNLTTSKNYGVFDLEFTTSGSYDNFINFTRALESNLRIVDISSISFSSNTVNNVGVPKTTLPESYQYHFKIKTYWLKN